MLHEYISLCMYTCTDRALCVVFLNSLTGYQDVSQLLPLTKLNWHNLYLLLQILATIIQGCSCIHCDWHQQQIVMEFSFFTLLILILWQISYDDHLVCEIDLSMIFQFHKTLYERNNLFQWHNWSLISKKDHKKQLCTVTLFNDLNVIDLWPWLT